MPQAKTQLLDGSGDMATKGRVPLLWNLGHADDSILCLCDSVVSLCTVSIIMKG